MHRPGHHALRLSLAAAIAGILTSPAQAYLDPGTGSIILQVLLGGVAGLALAGKLFWHRLLALLGIKREARPDGAGAGKQALEADASGRE